jgi:hypothetical protein
MTWGDDVAQSPSPTEPKRGRPTRVWHIFENRLIHVSREVGGVGQWRPRRLVGRQRVWSGSRPSAPNNLKLVLEILLTSYKYPPYPLSLEEIRKWGLASYSAPKFILCTIERERWGSEGQRTSRLGGTPLSSSSVEALPESVLDRRSFPSSSSIECGSSVGILWISTENWLSSPSGALESQIVIMRYR